MVRNTAPQLKDTTLVSWGYWFKAGEAGDWYATDKRFILRFDDVECEVLFRPLDTPDDVARVLSLEITFALIDEFVQIPKAIIEALAARLGRFPAQKDGGATNWGMWGASNPGTEDVWWYDYLHGPDVVRMSDKDVAEVKSLMSGEPKPNAHYYHQPSGLSKEAENLPHLPPYKEGDNSYYTNLMKGKTDAWIKQFIEAEWGFSIAGTPVIGSFKPNSHISKSPIRFNPLLPLIGGFDPGLAGSAFVFGQQDKYGRILILGELTQQEMGAERIIRERLKPYLRRRFPDLDRFIVAPDPAAGFRSNNDEKTIVSTIKKYYDVWYESNNRLPLRVDAYDHFFGQLVEPGPAVLIDEQECPMLIRALKGGWRWEVDVNKDRIKGAEPEKNQYSHVGDAGGYMMRYFHKQSERELRYHGKSKFIVPKFGNSYHFQ